MSDRRAWACLALLAIAACRQTVASPPPTTTAPAATTAAGSATVPHGDHNPHHGGIVMMKGDMHYEVVIDPTGRAHHVFFTDAVREDLPASIASKVDLTIHRAGAPDEPIALQIDDGGESWVGSGRLVASGQATGVGVSFTMQGEPYTIELPLTK